MMQISHLRFPYSGLLILLVMATCSKPLAAQPLVSQYSSIEAMIASAEFVAIGHIESVKEKATFSDADDGSKDGTTRAGVGDFGYVLTTKFDSILKNVDRTGKPSSNHDDYKSFPVIDQKGRNADVARLVANKTKGLWLIHTQEPTEAFHRWTFLPFDEAGVNQSGYRSGSLKPPVFASDFSILTTHKQILQRIKQYAPISQRQHRSDKPAVASVFVPRALLGEIGERGGTHYTLAIPVDSQLQNTARRLIELPADFVSANDAKDLYVLDTLRIAGIDLLGSTKTESSVQLLKDCLDDSVLPFEHSNSRVQIRTGAYVRLLIWNINPPKPAFASSVKRLFLADPRVNDDTLALVSEFENLESLCLWGAKITQAGINHLAKLKKLNELELNDEHVTNEFLQTLARNNQLHVLSQANTKDNLTRPTSAAQVGQLRFWYAPFTDAGLKQFRCFTNLTNIDLGRMKITDAALNDLTGFKKLKFATLRETSITKAGFAKLRKALPNCSVDSR